MARRVTGPDGRRWRVRRRWVAYERRVLRRRYLGEGVDVFGIPLSVPGDLGVLGFLVAAVALLAVAAVGILVAVELLVVLALVPLALLGRIALGRPWPVVAVTAGEQHRWDVRGWRTAGRQVDVVADALRRGHALPPGAGGSVGP